MYNKLYEHSLVVQSKIDANSDKMKKQDYKIEKLMAMVKNMMDHIKSSTFSPDKMN